MGHLIGLHSSVFSLIQPANPEMQQVEKEADAWAETAAVENR